MLEELKSLYDNANRHFLWSPNFVELVNVHTKKITSEPANKLIHIKKFMSALRIYKGKPLKHLIDRESQPHHAQEGPSDMQAQKRLHANDEDAVYPPNKRKKVNPPTARRMTAANQSKTPIKCNSIERPLLKRGTHTKKVDNKASGLLLPEKKLMLQKCCNEVVSADTKSSTQASMAINGPLVTKPAYKKTNFYNKLSQVQCPPIVNTSSKPAVKIAAVSKAYVKPAVEDVICLDDDDDDDVDSDLNDHKSLTKEKGSKPTPQDNAGPTFQSKAKIPSESNISTKSPCAKSSECDNSPLLNGLIDGKSSAASNSGTSTENAAPKTSSDRHVRRLEGLLKVKLPVYLFLYFIWMSEDFEQSFPICII